MTEGAMESRSAGMVRKASIDGPPSPLFAEKFGDKIENTRFNQRAYINMLHIEAAFQRAEQAVQDRDKNCVNLWINVAHEQASGMVDLLGVSDEIFQDTPFMRGFEKTIAEIRASVRANMH